MELKPRILLVHEVATLLRIAPVTVYRHLALRRKGIGTFPLPISTAGGKLRWLASDIEAFLQSQSNAMPPAKVASTSERRQEAKTYRDRQDAAQKVLVRHRRDRTTRAKKNKGSS